MRKLILLSSVFALSFGAFAQKEADAFGGLFGAAAGIGQATEATLQNVLEKSEEVREETAERFTELYNELRLMSEQATVTGAASDAALLGGMSADNINRANGVKQNLHAGSAISYANAGGQNCVIASGGKGKAIVDEGSQKEAKELADEGLALLSGKAGTDAANGRDDYLRLLAKKRKTFCDPADKGGADVECTGDGSNDHVNFFSMLSPEAYSEDNPMLKEKHDYFQQLITSTRNPVSVPPDLLVQPDTATDIMMVKADRLKAELSVTNAVFSKIRANRKKIPSTVADSLKERLEADGWSEAEVKKLTENGVSKKSMYKALTKGSSGSKMLLQKVSANERDLQANILGALALNNDLQYEILDMLEVIAASSALNVATSRDSATKELSAEISAKASRN